jgi:iron complex transport system substrate-binding protein
VTQCGRTLTFDKAPQVVVVDGERYALPLFDMGVGDRVTALFSHLAGAIPPDLGTPKDVLAKLTSLPALVGTAQSAYPSKEAFLAAKPDLVVEAYDGDAGNGALVALGINVFTLSPSCTGASLAASMQDTVTLGRILDVPDAAQQLVASWNKRIAAATAKAVAAGSGTPSVFFLDGISDKGEIWSNTGTFARELVAAGGGRLVPESGNAGDIYSVSKESVVTSNPDILLTYNTGATVDAPDKVAAFWPLIAGSPAEKARTYTVVPYPDGAGNVEFIEHLADAVVAFKSAAS